MEFCALAYGGFGFDGAAVGLYDAAGDGEAKARAGTCAVFVAGAGALTSVEAIEDVGQVACGDSFAGVGYGQLYTV